MPHTPGEVSAGPGEPVGEETTDGGEDDVPALAVGEGGGGAVVVSGEGGGDGEEDGDGVTPGLGVGATEGAGEAEGEGVVRPPPGPSDGAVAAGVVVLTDTPRLPEWAGGGPPPW